MLHIVSARACMQAPCGEQVSIRNILRWLVHLYLYRQNPSWWNCGAIRVKVDASSVFCLQGHVQYFTFFGCKGALVSSQVVSEDKVPVKYTWGFQCIAKGWCLHVKKCAIANCDFSHFLLLSGGLVPCDECSSKNFQPVLHFTLRLHLLRLECNHISASYLF